MSPAPEARVAGPETQGLLVRARRFVGALLEHVATRGELLAVELAEEKQRLIHTVIAAAILLMSAGMVLVFVAVLVLVLAWNTEYRELVAALIPLAFLLIGGGAYFWLRSLIARKSALFRDSLQALRRDAESLRA